MRSRCREQAIRGAGPARVAAARRRRAPAARPARHVPAGDGRVRRCRTPSGGAARVAPGALPRDAIPTASSRCSLATRTATARTPRSTRRSPHTSATVYSPAVASNGGSSDAWSRRCSAAGTSTATSTSWRRRLLASPIVGVTAAGQGASVDVNAAMVDYALRTVGRVLFGADVTDAVPVIRATFPVLNQHVRRRGITPLRLPRQWPTPSQIRASAARRALYDVVDAVIERRRAGSGRGDRI